MIRATNTPFGVQGAALHHLQIALIVAPSFILYGYNQANLGGLIKLQDWVHTFPQIDTVNKNGDSGDQKSTLQGFTVATFVVGAVLGAASCCWAGDRFGRRNCVFTASLCTLIGVLLEMSAFHIAHLMVGRVIIGFGAGMLTSVVPVWQSETSPPHTRGKHVVLDGVFLALGYVLESWINLAFYQFPAGPVTWRAPIAVAAFFSVVLMLSVYTFPESPRWLALKNRHSEARTVISLFRDLPENSIEVDAELSNIEMLLEDTRQQSVKLTDMFKSSEDKLLYRFLLCIILQFYPQLSGSNLISVYATILFQDNLQMDAQLSRVLSGSVLTWKFLSCFVAFFTIDRFGRRACFMVSGAGMSACMLAMAIATSYPASNNAAQIASAFFIFLFNFFVPIGFLGANFLYCAEVAPPRLRMAISSIATANHWLWNFVIVMVTPVALDSLGYKYYIIFASVACTIAPVIYLFYPETNGRNLEEIDLMFKESPSAFATVRFANKRQAEMMQGGLGCEKFEGQVKHLERSIENE